MIIMSVLLTLVLITVVKSYPISYSRYDLPQDHPILLLVDHEVPEMQNEMFDSSNDPGSTVIRTKRIGSLSIVNSLDVLRNRVLLELARRKAMQDQRQIDANRRILETIGKRSLSLFSRDSPKTINSKIRKDLEYVMEQEEKSHDQNTMPDRILGRMKDWTDDNVFQERQDDQMQRVQGNELRLL